MTMAADEQDTSRHAILQHAAQMQQQNSAALQEAQRLNAQLQEIHEKVAATTGRRNGQTDSPTTGRAR